MSWKEMTQQKHQIRAATGQTVSKSVGSVDNTSEAWEPHLQLLWTIQKHHVPKSFLVIFSPRSIHASYLQKLPYDTHPWAHLPINLDACFAQHADMRLRHRRCHQLVVPYNAVRLSCLWILSCQTLNCQEVGCRGVHSATKLLQMMGWSLSCHWIHKVWQQRHQLS